VDASWFGTPLDGRDHRTVLLLHRRRLSRLLSLLSRLRLASRVDELLDLLQLVAHVLHAVEGGPVEVLALKRGGR